MAYCCAAVLFVLATRFHSPADSPRSSKYRLVTSGSLWPIIGRGLDQTPDQSFVMSFQPILPSFIIMVPVKVAAART